MCAEAGLKLRHLVSPAVCEVFPQQQVELCSNGHDGRHKTTQPWQERKPTVQQQDILLFHHANTMTNTIAHSKPKIKGPSIKVPYSVKHKRPSPIFSMQLKLVVKK